MRAAHIHGINVCLVISVFKWKCTNWGKEALISKFVMKHPMNAITHRHPTEKKKVPAHPVWGCHQWLINLGLISVWNDILESFAQLKLFYKWILVFFVLFCFTR